MLCPQPPIGLGPGMIFKKTVLSFCSVFWRLRVKPHTSIALFNFLFLDNFSKGYVFHGDPEVVFKEFFGGNNPFSGTNCLKWNVIKLVENFKKMRQMNLKSFNS